MKFNTIEEAKNYLSSLDRVIVPKEYTYFLHCAAFELPEEAIKNKYSRSWTELPNNSFTVKREMSFVERKNRVVAALQYGGLEKANTSYAKSPDSKPFQIRVVISRTRLTDEEKEKLGLSSEAVNLLEREHMGLGDMRHTKLIHGEVIEIFATSIIDEVTKTKEDIFYGVRSQDLIRYAELVSEELELQNNIPLEILPNRETMYNWPDTTFSLPKSPNEYRYKRKYVSDGKGTIQLFQYSEFETEYLNELFDKKEKGARL
jgi:hypothetical protein